MKRIVIFLLSVMLLAAPAFAAETAPSADLRFGAAEDVYSIDAVYAVRTQGVADLRVTFADGISFAAHNYVGGNLKIAIASIEPIDLSGSVGQVTAVLENGQEAAPELELTSLCYNGEGVSENLFLTGVETSVSGEALTLSLSAHSDFPGRSYRLVCAAYDGTGRMLAVNMQPVTFAQQDVSCSARLSACKDAVQVKVFFVTENLKPVTGVWTRSPLPSPQWGEGGPNGAG